MEFSSEYPGFRFAPTDQELICHYLKRKVSGLENNDVISEVDICKYEPWDLPAKSVIPSDHQWFFFSPNGRKYPNGSQARRATAAGFWKATGKERAIKSGSNVIGTKRTLVFHIGRAPNGERTDWIMHEYCIRGNKVDKPQDTFVICRLRKKQELTPDTVNPSLQSSNHDDSSPGNASLHNGSQVDAMDTQQAEVGVCGESKDGTLKFIEDDCFADILQNDIVKLDDMEGRETPFQLQMEKLQTMSRPTKVTEMVCSLKSYMNPCQGSARRRIGLETHFLLTCGELLRADGVGSVGKMIQGDDGKQQMILKASKVVVIVFVSIFIVFGGIWRFKC